MSVTRSGSEALGYAQYLSADYIMPLDPNGSPELSKQMLKAAISRQRRQKTAVQHMVSRNESIRLLGYMKISKAEVFHPASIDQKVPRRGFLKDIAGGKISLRKAKINNYSDFAVQAVPYLVCNVPDLAHMPIDIDVPGFDSQMKMFQKPNTLTSSTKENQLCTWGAFVTAFHRDTMFSKKVHTISPDSMKLWCFERRIGQLKIIAMGDVYEQMRHVTRYPTDFNFFFQEHGEIIEHLGGYAHLVMTFNKIDSKYGQWCALIGWENNNSRQIDQCMRVETPLLQGRSGTLNEVSETVYLQACSKTTAIKCALLREQGDHHDAFLDLQKEKSRKRVEMLDQSKKKKLQRYAGLKYRTHPKLEPSPSSASTLDSDLL